MRISHFIAAFAATLSCALLAVPAAAISLELGLALDDSGSITDSNFALQRNGYIAALQDSSVMPLDGSVAIEIVKFSDDVNVIYPMTVLTSANIASVISALQHMTRSYGETNIAGAITSITNTIFTNAITSDRQIIDISTDGDNNIGDLNASRNAAIAAGIDQINCIGIGGAANCAPVIAGAGSFELNATFANFGASLKQKIAREVSGVPEPASWAMMILGFGLIGGALRRDRRIARLA